MELSEVEQTVSRTTKMNSEKIGRTLRGGTPHQRVVIFQNVVFLKKVAINSKGKRQFCPNIFKKRTLLFSPKKKGHFCL